MRVDGRETEAEIVALRPELRVRLAEAQHVVAVGRGGGDRFDLTVDGVRYTGWRCSQGDAVYVRLRGRTYTAHFVRREAKREGAAAQDEVRANMPGIVVAVHCREGQRVMTGEPLLTLESMKLQMTVVASHEGTVEKVHVAPEAVFERGALLVSIAQETQKP
jgi:biotin carboxyl carrier protein